MQGYGYRPVYQGDQTSYTCSGLRRVTCYNFRLAASNEKGQSQMSPSVTFKTLPSVPGPPAVPFLKDRPQANSLNVAWVEPPDNGGSEIQTYVLQMSGGMSSKGGASELVDVYMGPFKTYLAEGLLPGRKYETRVRIIAICCFFVVVLFCFCLFVFVSFLFIVVILSYISTLFLSPSPPLPYSFFATTLLEIQYTILFRKKVYCLHFHRFLVV